MLMYSLNCSKNSLGEAPVQEIHCCPKTSKDANGLTETIDIRWLLMQLGLLPILNSAKALRLEDVCKALLNVSSNLDTS